LRQDVKRDGDGTVWVEVGVQAGSERIGNGGLELEVAPTGSCCQRSSRIRTPGGPVAHRVCPDTRLVDSLVSSPTSLAIDGAKARDDDADGHFSYSARTASAAAGPTSRSASGSRLARPRHYTHDFGVAHLEVA
jgi:hypothetical protein